MPKHANESVSLHSRRQWQNLSPRHITYAYVMSISRHFAASARAIRAYHHRWKPELYNTHLLPHAIIPDLFTPTILLALHDAENARRQ